MIKHFIAISLLLQLCIGGKPPGNIYFSKFDRRLDQIRPLVESDVYFTKGNKIYFYIYSTKKFETDNLFIMFVHLDNKGVYFPKMENAQTLQIDVDPETTAIKGEVVIYKTGQYMARVFNLNKPKKPIAEGPLWID